MRGTSLHSSPPPPTFRPSGGVEGWPQKLWTGEHGPKGTPNSIKSNPLPQHEFQGCVESSTALSLGVASSRQVGNR